MAFTDAEVQAARAQWDAAKKRIEDAAKHHAKDAFALGDAAAAIDGTLAAKLGYADEAALFAKELPEIGAERVLRAVLLVKLTDTGQYTRGKDTEHMVLRVPGAPGAKNQFIEFGQCTLEQLRAALVLVGGTPPSAPVPSPAPAPPKAEPPPAPTPMPAPPKREPAPSPTPAPPKPEPAPAPKSQPPAPPKAEPAPAPKPPPPAPPKSEPVPAPAPHPTGHSHPHGRSPPRSRVPAGIAFALVVTAAAWWILRGGCQPAATVSEQPVTTPLPPVPAPTPEPARPRPVPAHAEPTRRPPSPAEPTPPPEQYPVPKVEPSGNAVPQQEDPDVQKMIDERDRELRRKRQRPE